MHHGCKEKKNFLENEVVTSCYVLLQFSHEHVISLISKRASLGPQILCLEDIFHEELHFEVFFCILQLEMYPMADYRLDQLEKMNQKMFLICSELKFKTQYSALQHYRIKLPKT